MLVLLWHKNHMGAISFSALFSLSNRFPGCLRQKTVHSRQKSGITANRAAQMTETDTHERRADMCGTPLSLLSFAFPIQYVQITAFSDRASGLEASAARPSEGVARKPRMASGSSFCDEKGDFLHETFT
jgi:hypothetical protein